jgi:hypothetical protein
MLLVVLRVYVCVYVLGGSLFFALYFKCSRHFNVLNADATIVRV